MKVQEPARVLAWVEQLADPNLGYPEQLDIVACYWSQRLNIHRR